MKKEIGINLLIDIYPVEKNFLKRKSLLDLLEKILKIINSKPVGKPIIKKIVSNKYPYSGYSLVQIIQESHIAFHTWPEYYYLAIDIFSCKKFSQKRLINFLKKFFPKSKMKVSFLKRVVEVNYF